VFMCARAPVQGAPLRAWAEQRLSGLACSSAASCPAVATPCWLMALQCGWGMASGYHAEEQGRG